jgi:hypothetical protein
MFWHKVPVILVRLVWILNFLDKSSRDFEILNIMKITPVGSYLFHAEGRTEGETNKRTDIYIYIYIFKYCLLAIRLEDTSVYNLICWLVVMSWKGDHPAMSPQSCRSEDQRLFSLLWRVGCVSVSTSGLGWDSSLLRCLVILSLITSLT